MKANHCHECGQQLKVTGTRHAETTTLRRKKCSNCGKLSVTIELRHARFAQLLAAEQELVTLKGNSTIPEPMPDYDALAYQEEVEREFQDKRSKLRWGK
jgi:hypothetical protein